MTVIEDQCKAENHTQGRWRREDNGDTLALYCTCGYVVIKAKVDSTAFYRLFEVEADTYFGGVKQE